MNHKFVFDINSLISAALIRTSVNAQVLSRAIDAGRIIISEPVLLEFSEVIFRKKFDKYFLFETERLEAIDRIESNALVFFPKTIITACRDPKDNKFLELAVAAGASCIVTGDQDLLTLHPYQGIPILSPADFLKLF